MRRVRSNGEIKWGGELIFVSRLLTGEPVAITETENGEWLVRFADVTLGFIDPKRQRLYHKSLVSHVKQACGLGGNAKMRCPLGPQAQQKQTT